MEDIRERSDAAAPHTVLGQEARVLSDPLDGKPERVAGEDVCIEEWIAVGSERVQAGFLKTAGDWHSDVASRWLYRVFHSRRTQ